MHFRSRIQWKLTRVNVLLWEELHRLNSVIVGSGVPIGGRLLVLKFSGGSADSLHEVRKLKVGAQSVWLATYMDCMQEALSKTLSEGWFWVGRSHRGQLRVLPLGNLTEASANSCPRACKVSDMKQWMHSRETLLCFIYLTWKFNRWLACARETAVS